MCDFENNSNINNQDIIDVLKTVYDPDIHYSIYDIGLIYKIVVDKQNILVIMTLTSVDCPEAQSIPQNVIDSLSSKFEGFTVDVELVFEPAWTVENMSDEIKLGLGLL